MPRKPMKDMAAVAELVLKELRRRGGHDALAAKLEGVIRAARELHGPGKERDRAGSPPGGDGGRPGAGGDVKNKSGGRFPGHRFR